MAERESVEGGHDGLLLDIEENGVHLCVRPSMPDDVPDLVAIDQHMYREAYATHPTSSEELTDMLARRQHNAGDWLRVLELNGCTVGFITSFPTRKPPEQFTSWEDSTNHGTLDGVVDPEGPFHYTANLTVLPIASRHNGDAMLEAEVYADIVRYGYTSYFESRMKFFRRWLESYAQHADTTVEELSQPENAERLFFLAKTYASMSVSGKSGRRVRRDPHLRKYEESIGFRLLDVVPNAMQDPESMDFGVVVLVESIIPERLRYNSVNWLGAYALRRMARSPRLSGKFFS